MAHDEEIRCLKIKRHAQGVKVRCMRESSQFDPLQGFNVSTVGDCVVICPKFSIISNISCKDSLYLLVTIAEYGAETNHDSVVPLSSWITG